MSVYGDKTYRKRTAALKRANKTNNTPCWICGHPFDWTIDDYRHPMSWTADHIDALGNGGKLLGELQGAHRSCNSRRGKAREVKTIQPPKTKRRW